MSTEQGGASSDASGTGRQKRPRPQDSSSSICPTCDEEVSADHNGVQCQWCQVWEHCKCAKISQGEYNMLSLGSARIMFFCCDCQSSVNQAFEFFDNMYSRQSLFDKRLQNIEDKLGKLTQGLCGPPDGVDVIEMSCDDSAGNNTEPTRPSGLLPKIDTGGITSAVASAISEEKERNKRKLNLILHNVTEPSSDDGNCRKKEDIEHVSNIFRKNLGVTVKVTNAVRLGKRNNKPRLLKVSVDSEHSKAAILRNSTKLRGKDVPQCLSKVFITPDMTIKEREKNKHLRAELAELNKDGKKYKIKNGKIVQRNS